MQRTALSIALLTAASLANAGTWTYQGTLNDGGQPANGRYALRLTLVDAAGTRSLTQPVTLPSVEVKDGNFAVDVDFGLDLNNAPVLKLKTEVAQGGSAFVSLGEPARFDPKAALAGICWDTVGNVVAPGEFVGSTNNAALEIRSNNLRAARFSSAGADNRVNVLMGSPANIITGYGATIAGGGGSASTCGLQGTSSCANVTDETFATIGGGAGNSIVGIRGTIAGGDSNSIGGGPAASIGGGLGNYASGRFSGVAGGLGNTATGSQSNIGGGESNSVNGTHSNIGGGQNNTAGGSWNVVAGGQSNGSMESHSTVAGGSNNRAHGSASVVSGGLFNHATGSRGVVAGGESGTASGAYSFVAGGLFNCAGGEYSFAGGNNAEVRVGTQSGAVGEGCSGVASAGTPSGDAGSFVWSGSQSTAFTTTGPNQFLVRASGGVAFNTNSLPFPSSDDLVVGARSADGGGDADADITLLSRNGKRAQLFVSDTSGGLSIGLGSLALGSSRISVSGGAGGAATLSNGGTWTNASSRAFKEGFAAVDPIAVLERVIALPITTWTYRGSAEGLHMGPMAEDFKASFGLAGDGRSIGTVDADGVALAAIQGLHQKLEQAQAENAALKNRLEAIEAQLAR